MTEWLNCSFKSSPVFLVNVNAPLLLLNQKEKTLHVEHNRSGMTCGISQEFQAGVSQVTRSLY